MHIPMGLVGLMLMALLMTLALSGCDDPITAGEKNRKAKAITEGIPVCERVAYADGWSLYQCKLKNGTTCYTVYNGGLWCK